MTHDPINHPVHYTAHPSGIECIDVTRHMGFNLGNAVKYIWRADLKNNAIEDLKKAIWYLQDEIKKREAGESVDAAVNRDAVKRHPGYAANGVVKGAEMVKPEDLCTEGDDGPWARWSGSEQPPAFATVDVKLRNGNILRNWETSHLYWRRLNRPSDIVAYRLAK